jgi:hypothetical protein
MRKVDYQQRITEQTLRWAQHEGVGEVGTTSSFANMEALLKREYFGRFVIELIQNARDAWYANGRPRTERCVVRVLLHADPPVLTVCNQGNALDSEGLIKHIAQFGESSKKAGAGIGHKGIGFKSVLEVTRCPEILSRPDESGPFDLRVRFDPRLTEALIDSVSPRPWRELVLECDPNGLRDKDQRLPVLRFPHWLDSLAPEVETESKLDGTGFNTLVRLPYHSDFDERLGLARTTWLDRVRQAMAGVSDEIVMLLDAFRRVQIDDHLGGPSSAIFLESRELRPLAGGGAVRLVELIRSGANSSSWFLYERSVERLGSESLAGEIVVGVRVERSDGMWRPVLPTKQGRCFHLFFPTRIETHLPFLLHAYFEVDAGRTRFAPDAMRRNGELLKALHDLVLECVEDLVCANDVDTRPLASLFGAAAGQPEDPLARSFRDDVLQRLDLARWVPVMGARSAAAPSEVLVFEREDLSSQMPLAFPPAYLKTRVGLFHPSAELVQDDLARRFLASRSGRMLLGSDGILKALLRPGTDLPIWDAAPEHVDSGFRAMMGVLGIVAINDSEAFRQLASSLRGDPTATILPAVCSGINDDDPQRRFLPPPSEERGFGTSVFARISEAGTRRTDSPNSEIDVVSAPTAEIGVPECLEMAFLPTDTLTPELLAGPADALGVRPFGTDAVLDQLPVRNWTQVEAPAVTRFVWRLLLRESVSRYGLKAALDARQNFEPGKWFWCDPSLVQDRARRPEILRRQALANLPLPARDGTWRPAGRLCFGSDWASGAPLTPDDRLVTDTLKARHAAYCDLEALADGPHWLVAGPATLAEALPLSKEDLHWLRDDLLAALRLSGEPRLIEEVEDSELERLHQDLLHILLLTLGVWEVPPVDAVLNDLRPEASRADPWDDREIEGRQAWRSELDDRRPAWFGVSYSHAHVRIAVDYRLIWPMHTPEDSSEDSLLRARALSRGAKLYGRLLRTHLFCHRCSYHKNRLWSRADGPPNSFLHWQLSRTAWVPVVVDAQPAPARAPSATWWMKDPPDDPARIAINPRRFLPLVRRGVGSDLLRSVGGNVLDEAGPEELQRLLLDLREDFENDMLPVNAESGAGRQAFVGLHRLLYAQLARAGEPERAQAIVDEVGVLAHEGAQLRFKPRTGIVYNDGTHGAFKGHFVGKVPFAPLNVGDEDIARALGLRFFEVKCTMGPVATSESQTEVVGDFIEERLPEVMALLTQLALGGRPLDIDSEQFRVRSQRLRELEVVRVPDVVLELSVVLPDREPIATTIGEGANHDAFLDWQPRRAPVLYHDFQGPNWFEPLRRRLGEVVARLVENAAFRDTLSLFFQVDEDARETFLAERGVTAGTLDEIRKSLGRAGHVATQLSRNWWVAVLGIAGASVDNLPTPPDEEVGPRLASLGWGDSAARNMLIEAGGGDDVRSDTGPDGVLDLLEANGVALEQLDCRLRELGDVGLRIHVAEDSLRRWRSEHGGKVAFALVRREIGLDEAKARVRAWQVPGDQRHRVRVDAAAVLVDVAADLEAVGVHITANDLASDRMDAVLAQALGVPLQEWERTWRQIFSPEERQRLLRERTLAWREAAEIPVVALLTVPGDLPHRLRAARELYREQVPGNLARPTEVREAVQEVLQERGLLERAQQMMSLLPVADELDLPDRNALEASLPDWLAVHVAEVRATLQRRGRERLDAIRKSSEELRAAGITPKPFAASPIEPRASKPKAQEHRKKVQVGKVGKRDLQRIGARGESWALAAVMGPLESLLSEKPDAFDNVVQSLRDLLVGHWDGAAVNTLAPHADRALDRSLSSDDRLEALAEFLHLSEVSDGFGCDLLGWLPPYEGAEPRPLALEVKSSTNRSFLASDHEWEAAKRLDEDYAFLVVLRKGREVRGMDLLSHSEALRELRVTDTWKVAYSMSRTTAVDEGKNGDCEGEGRGRR